MAELYKNSHSDCQLKFHQGTAKSHYLAQKQYKVSFLSI